MPADEAFVRMLRSAVRIRGGRLLEAPEPDAAPNPFRFQFDLQGNLFGVLVHVRRITPQRGVETHHGRPEGEWHTQMIFDGDNRGAGVRNHLRTDPALATVLFGFAEFGENNAPVLAAWDPSFHDEYSYSTSLQVREETLQEAHESGLAEQSRQTAEVIVAFRPEYVPEYLSNRSHWHGTIPVRAGEERVGAGEGELPTAPPDDPNERGVKPLSGTRVVRDIRFRGYIHAKYSCCAACGLTAESLLDAAHILSVSEDGSDHYSNGLRLCKNCHSLFDAGLLLIHPSYQIELSVELEQGFPDDAERLRRDLMDELLIPNIPDEYRPDPNKLRRVWQERLT